MWNVVGPFEVGNPVDSEVVSEVVRSQNRHFLSLAEEDSEPQIAVTVVDSVVAEGEGGEAEVSVAVAVASVADAMTLGVVGVVVGTAAVDSGV